MSAFGATAEDVTASSGVSAVTAVEIGVDAVTWVSLIPRLAAGKRISPDSDALNLVEGTFRPSSGKRTAVPVNAQTLLDKTPRLTVGAAVFLTKQNLTPSNQTARLTTGGAGLIGFDALTHADSTFALRAGKRIAISPDVQSLIEKIPRPSSGSNLYVSLDALAIANPIPRLSKSIVIRLHKTDSSEFTIAATGDDATAADATLAAEPTAQTHYDPDQIFLTNATVRPSSGGAGVVPSDDLTETDPAIEIGARRRKLRVWSILH